jgi:hypothetical protein
MAYWGHVRPFALDRADGGFLHSPNVSLNLHLDGPLARRQNRALGGTLIDLELLHHRFLRRSHGVC